VISRPAIERLGAAVSRAFVVVTVAEEAAQRHSLDDDLSERLWSSIGKRRTMLGGQR
jgi:hypothetical protein